MLRGKTTIEMQQVEDFDMIRKELSLLNKDDILALFFNKLQKFLNKSKYPVSHLDLEKHGWTDLKKIPGKENLLYIIPILYNDKGLMEGYFNSLSQVEQKVTEKALWQATLNRKEFEEIYGMPVLSVQVRWSNYVDIDLVPEVKNNWGTFITVLRPFGYFNDRKVQLKHTEIAFSFPTILKRLYSLQLPKPAGYEFQPLSNLNEKWEILNFEKDIFQVLPSVLSYVVQGKMKFSQKGYVNKASAKKMSKSLKLKEFSEADPNCMRSFMLAGFMGSQVKPDAINSPVLKTLEKIFSVDLTMKNTTPFMLPFLKGLNFFHSYQFNNSITKNLWLVFRHLPIDKWISFENLKIYVTGRFIDLIPLNKWELTQRVEAERVNLKESHETEFISLNESNLFQVVGLSYLAAHVYFMASWGLMEIAVDPNKPMNFSPYDQLAAFRLTPLGAYILRISSQYSPPENAVKTALTFDENSLFIRIEGNTDFGDTMLNNFTNKVSENRYQFNAGKFLKDVTNSKNLINKINLFKQTIGQQLPRYWEGYLQQLVQNSKQLKFRSDVVVFTLPADNPEMHRQVAQDELLRRISIKAEKYQLIVDKKDVLVFAQRMKEFGYLIDHYLLA